MGKHSKPLTKAQRNIEIILEQQIIKAERLQSVLKKLKQNKESASIKKRIREAKKELRKKNFDNEATIISAELAKQLKIFEEAANVDKRYKE